MRVFPSTCLAVLVALPGAALAEGTAVAVRGLGGVEASPLATLLRLVAALFIVLIVFWGCARLLRHLNVGGGGVTGVSRAGLRIVGALPLGSRERLVIVQAGDEQLLLGVTATRIERLHRLETPIAAPGKAADGGDFRTRLLAAMERRTPS